MYLLFDKKTHLLHKEPIWDVPCSEEYQFLNTVELAYYATMEIAEKHKKKHQTRISFKNNGYSQLFSKYSGLTSRFNNKDTSAFVQNASAYRGKFHWNETDLNLRLGRYN